VAIRISSELLSGIREFYYTINVHILRKVLYYLNEVKIPKTLPIKSIATAAVATGKRNAALFKEFYNQTK
jgi:hypothetical protein